MDKDKYIGRLLDNRYEILEVIGTGGMAVVYKARCHRLNRLVAVKILKDDNLDDEDFRRRFHAESQAVAMLSHPNIVSVYDVSTSVMADYIVMELIEGITLKQYMAKKGVLNWKETLHFAMQIAKALEHAHSKGIVHRDIKPHNIMVLKNGSVKVMDFGIARMISRGNTLTKEALGSVHYISPEQARGGRIDDRSDIYSLGVVMYEMMAGRPPYDGESPVAVAIQHINGGAALPSVLNPNIPGGLEQIIMKAMARNVSERYPSATRMLADMDEFRKDPTILFDYTGIPLDAAIRMQKPPISLTEQEKPDGNGMPELQPRRENRPNSVANPPRQTPRREPPKNREPQPRRKAQPAQRSRSTVIAIAVCSLVAVIAIGIFMAVLLGGGLTPGEKLVTVPKLVGQNFADLQEYPGLIINKQEVNDDTIPAGQIISQQPEADIQVAQNSRVVVMVSLGPRPHKVTLLELQDKTREWAESYLNGQGINLVVDVKEEYNDSVAEGLVFRTNPVAGTELSQGQTITLWVSKGKKVQFAAMPNVVGEEKDKAVNILKQQELDLDVVVEEVFHPTIAVGTVIESEPGRGEKLKTGQTVTIRVSKGIAKEIMIDFVGMELAQAESWLESKGFPKPTIQYVEGSDPKGTVLSQSLKKDTEYEITVAITLEVSDGSKMPVAITKDVVIDLRGRAQNNRCKVSVKRDGEEVYLSTVPKGMESVILPDQIGFGTVVYSVLIDDYDGWVIEEVFTVLEEPTVNG